MPNPWDKDPIVSAPKAGPQPWDKDLIVSAAKPPVNKDFEAGKAKPAWAQGLVLGANGLLLGFGDELAGGVGAVIDKVKNPSSTLSDNYVANRDTVRGMEAAQRERAPITSAIGQGLSSLPLTFALPTVAGGLRATAAAPVVAGVGARALQSAAVGAGLGAVAGAGGSVAATATDIAGDALKGGLLSGALGAAGAPVAAGAVAVGRNVGQRLSESAAATFAAQKIAQALSRDARGTLATSGMVSPLGQAAARFDKLGDEAVLADAGGRNTNQLLDTLATLPGRTKEAAYNMLRQRTAGVGDRMRDSAEKALDINGQRLGTTVDSLITQRSQAAGPLYTQLRGVDITPTPALVDIVTAADKLGATKLGREIATARQLPFSLDPGAQGPARWNMGDLDHIKQGIDQVLGSSKAVAKDGSMTPLGNAYQTLKDRLTGELDAATTNPQTGASLYGQARAAFAGPSKLIDAANAGKLAISREESSILSTVKGMSGNELEAFRIGAFDGLRGKLGMQGGQTEIMNMWKNPATQEKLRVIFGDERAYRTFAADVAKESTLKRLQTVGVGSQTAARQSGMGDLDVGALTDAGAAVGAAKTGNILSAIGSAKNVWNRAATPQAVRDQMGAMLLSRGTEAQQTMNSLAPLIQRVNQQNLQLSNHVGVQFGNNFSNQLLAQPLPPANQ
jgi:hypothetical protein